jgi:metallo-beta-lactamase class B
MYIKKSSFAVCISVFVSLVFLLPSIYANSHSDEHRLSPREDPAIQYVEPFKIFDNLSFVGMEWVSAYVLETSEGLVSSNL